MQEIECKMQEKERGCLSLKEAQPSKLNFKISTEREREKTWRWNGRFRERDRDRNEDSGGGNENDAAGWAGRKGQAKGGWSLFTRRSF